jgi:hypothetical protein
MIFISHRGNLRGPNPAEENHPDYISAARSIADGVEIDVWFIDGKFALGHDKAQYEVDKDFIRGNGMWCHAKNIAALEEMTSLGAHCFWHQEDDYVLTSMGYIWTYPGKELAQMSIAVMPELINLKDASPASGVCSDYIMEWMK